MYVLSLVVLEEIELNLMGFVLEAVELELLILMLAVLTGDLEFAEIKPWKENCYWLLYWSPGRR